MRYQMRQKFFALADEYTIKDESGADRFRVVGRVLSFGDKLSFCEMDGREVLRIEQRLLTWGPTYEILQGDRTLAVVKKELFTFFRCKFTVDVPGPDDITAEGSFLDQEYDFHRDGRIVASVSRKFFSWTDTYGIEISSDVPHVLILASAVVIDLVCHDGKHH